MVNYCLSSQCDKKTLATVQEIRLAANDDIFDYIEKFPKARLIVPYPNNTPAEELRRYAKLGRITLAIRDFKYLTFIRENNIPWFYDGPVSTFFDLNNLARLGSSFVLLDSPLFHELDKVRDVLPATTAVAIRLIPNIAYWAFIPAPSGIPGSWLRPEDIQYFKDLPITIEFGDCEERPRKEEALYKVYKEGSWKGDLGNIITNLHYNCDNELIPPDLIEKRVKCGQRCQSGGSCHICYRLLQIANKDFI